MNTRHNSERGLIDGWMISTIGLIVLTLATGAVAVWAYVNYNEQKTDVDGKVSIAVAEAKKEQADEDEKKFAEREKEPKREFVGPDDYGRLTFMYPKTWSAYVGADTSKGGSYSAFLNPGVVPPSTVRDQRFALRVLIEEKDYDAVLRTYEQLVKKGELRSSAVAVDGQNGTRLDGNFTKDIRGAAVVYKIRDKTLTVFTDADTFKPDFDALITTIKFNT